MSRKPNPPMPDRPFALLLVEGGDERAVCKAIVDDATWANLHCWVASGRNDLPLLAREARQDDHFDRARRVGVVMDVEDELVEAQALAEQTMAPFRGVVPAHVFLAPDGRSQGCIESLCRRAVRDARRAACVDALLACVGGAGVRPPRDDKGWLNAYLAMSSDPRTRFHQAFEMSDGIDPAHPTFQPLLAFLRSLIA